MKKLFFILILVFAFSVTPTLADGDMGAGTKTCQGTNCFVETETENVDFISMIYKKLFALIY